MSILKSTKRKTLLWNWAMRVFRSKSARFLILGVVLVSSLLSLAFQIYLSMSMRCRKPCLLHPKDRYQSAPEYNVKVAEFESLPPGQPTLIQTVMEETCLGFTWWFRFPAVKYKVRIRRVARPDLYSEWFVLGGNENGYATCGLENHTAYQVTVNALGVVPIADVDEATEIMWTTHLAPPVPEPPKIHFVGKSTIHLEIPPVRHEFGPITAIEIRIRQGGPSDIAFRGASGVEDVKAYINEDDYDDDNNNKKNNYNNNDDDDEGNNNNYIKKKDIDGDDDFKGRKLMSVPGKESLEDQQRSSSWHRRQEGIVKEDKRPGPVTRIREKSQLLWSSAKNENWANKVLRFNTEVESVGRHTRKNVRDFTIGAQHATTKGKHQVTKHPVQQISLHDDTHSVVVETSLTSRISDFVRTGTQWLGNVRKTLLGWLGFRIHERLGDDWDAATGSAEKEDTTGIAKVKIVSKETMADSDTTGDASTMTHTPPPSRFPETTPVNGSVNRNRKLLSADGVVGQRSKDRHGWHPGSSGLFRDGGPRLWLRRRGGMAARRQMASVWKAEMTRRRRLSTLDLYGHENGFVFVAKRAKVRRMDILTFYETSNEPVYGRLMLRDPAQASYWTHQTMLMKGALVERPVLVRNGNGYFLSDSAGRRFPYFNDVSLLITFRRFIRFKNLQNYYDKRFHTKPLTQRDKDLQNRVNLVLYKSRQRCRRRFYNLWALNMKAMLLHRPMPMSLNMGLPPGHTTGVVYETNGSKITIGENYVIGNVPSKALEPGTQYEITVVVLSSVVDITKHSWVSVNVTTVRHQGPPVLYMVKVILAGLLLTIASPFLVGICLYRLCRAGRRRR